MYTISLRSYICRNGDYNCNSNCWKSCSSVCFHISPYYKQWEGKWYILADKMRPLIIWQMKISKVHWTDTWDGLCYLISVLKMTVIHTQKSEKEKGSLFKGEHYNVLTSLRMTMCSLMPDSPEPICAQWCGTKVWEYSN